MLELLATLARIEAQNNEILAHFSPPRQSLSVKEAAWQLRRSDWTVRQLCLNGLIRANKDNGTWRIPADEIERLEKGGIPRLPAKLPKKA